MPEVRRYGGRKVGLDPLPDVRRQAAETNLSTGAGLEQAKGQAAAQTFGALGQVAGEVGSQIAQVVVEEQKKSTDASIYAFDNALARYESQTLYTGPNAALNRKHLDAQGLPEQIDADFEAYADQQALALLHTPEAKAAGAKLRAQRGTNINLQLRQHAYREANDYYEGQLKGTLANSLTAAVTNANVLYRIGEELDKSTAAIKESGPARGLSPAEIEDAVHAQRTAIHAAVITQRIANGDDASAAAYFRDNQDDISGTAKAELQTRVDVASTQGEGLRTAEALWTQFGPPPGDDNAPINIDQMEAAAREQHAGDTKTLTATINYLRERAAGVKAGRQDRKGAHVDAVWSAVFKGADLRQVERMREFQALPGGEQLQIQQTILKDAEQRADRSYMLAARPSVASVAAARAEKEKEDHWFGMLNHYEDPAVLIQMKRSDILGLTPVAGTAQVARLLQRWDQIQADPATYRAARIDEDEFTDIAATALPELYKTPANQTDATKAMAGKLRAEVNDRIASEYTTTGKIPTPQRKREIMTGLVQQKVLINVAYGADPERIALAVVNAEERDAAYVPFATIEQAAPPFIDDALNRIARQTEANQRLPRAELLARSRTRIERAYARKLMGGTNAEVLAALFGDTGAP